MHGRGTVPVRNHEVLILRDDRTMSESPSRSRPVIPDYGIPESEDGLLSWERTSGRLGEATNYWVATSGPTGKPHAVPVQGAWIGGALYFGGGPDVKWVRNLRSDPRVSVHLESGDDVVILEGKVERAGEPESLMAEIADVYEKKYGYRHPPPFWTLRPRVAFAWTDFAKDPTRFRFAGHP